MASVQKDIGQVQFPFVNMKVPEADTTKARQATLVGGLARQAIKDKASVDLVGGEVEDALVSDTIIPAKDEGAPEQSDYTEIEEDDDEENETVFRTAKRYTPKEKRSAYNDALNDPDLNLRKVAAMRKQGKLSASGAKALVNKSVQEASARLPGSAEQFRQKASAFFGDFGEGGGLLKNTFQEDLQEAMQKKLALGAISHGFGYQDPETGEVYQTQDQLDLYMQTLQNNFLIDNRTKQLSLEVAQGTRDVNTLVSRAGNGSFEKSMNLTIASISSDLSSGRQFEPQDVQVYGRRIYAAETSALLSIDQEVNALLAQDKPVDPTKVAALKQSIKDEGKRTREFLTSNSFAELIKKNKELLSNSLAVDGMNAFKEIAALNAAGGETFVKFGLEILPRLERMTDGQRQVQFGVAPDEEYLWNRRAMFHKLRQARGELESGNLPEDSFVRGLAIEDARNNLTQKDSRLRPQSINMLIEARKELGAGTYEAFINPKFADTAIPSDIEAMTNLIVTEMGTSEKLIISELKASPHLDIRYDPNNRKTPFSIQFKEGQKKRILKAGEGFSGFNDRTLAAEISPGLRDSIQAQNYGHNIHRNFSRHPKFVINFSNESSDTFYAKSFSTIKKGVARPEAEIRGEDEEKTAAPAKEKEIKLGKGKLEQLKPGVYQDDDGNFFRVTTDGEMKRLDDES